LLLDMARIFLLSPAYAGGKRAQMILNDRAEFDLALRLRNGEGVALGEVFAFLSGLYFRGKLAYAKAFARPISGMCGTLVITPNRGLMPVDSPIDLNDLRGFAEVEINENDSRYRKPLERGSKRLARQIEDDCDVILLGSVATGKYTEILRRNFRDQLRFPAEFVGRGDMSRGSLMLRCAVDGRELEYVRVDGTVRVGKRPPKLEPRRSCSRGR
jgi:hypothetical protein